MRVADDGQIGTAARRFKIGIVGRDTPEVATVDGVRRDAAAERRVVIGIPAIVEIERRLAQGRVDWSPGVERRAVDRDRAATAMVGRVAEVEVVFQPVKVGQRLFARPAETALRGPLVIILKHAANGDLAVDRRAAAQAPSTPVALRGAPLRMPRLQPRPLMGVEALLHEQQRWIRATQFVGRVGRTPVRAGFEQQHPRATVLGQPRRQSRACRTCADDQVIIDVGHGGPSPVTPRSASGLRRCRPSIRPVPCRPVCVIATSLCHSEQREESGVVVLTWRNGARARFLPLVGMTRG